MQYHVDRLFQAIKRPDITALHQIVTTPGLDLNRERDGKTPLFVACETGEKSVVQFLLQNGAKPNLQGLHELVPLHVATQKRNKDIVEILLQHKANPNICNATGATPLHFAASCGDYSIAQILLSYGADCTMRSGDGSSPADMARSAGYRELSAMLEEKARADSASFTRATPSITTAPVAAGDLSRKLDAAVVAGDVRAVGEVLGKNVVRGTDITGQIMCRAAATGKAQILSMLVGNGGDVNARDFQEYCPLMRAAQNGHTECVRFLLQQGANVNAFRSDGETALHIAIAQGHLPCIQMLLSHGADADMKYHGLTALQHAQQRRLDMSLFKASPAQVTSSLSRMSLRSGKLASEPQPRDFGLQRDSGVRQRSGSWTTTDVPRDSRGAYPAPPLVCLVL